MKPEGIVGNVGIVLYAPGAVEDASVTNLLREKQRNGMKQVQQIQLDSIVLHAAPRSSISI